MDKQLLQQTAQSFINKYLEHTNNRMDRISVKDLYNLYTESTRFSVSKPQFNKLLTKYGYMVAASGGNKLSVFYVRCSFLEDNLIDDDDF